MSMSCLRMRSSNRSSGPSYTCPTTTENDDSLEASLRAPSGGCVGAGCACSTIVLNLLPVRRRRLVFKREVRCGPDFVHRRFCCNARFGRSLLQRVPCQLRIDFILRPTFLDRSQHTPEAVGGPLLALNATDARASATFVDLRNRLRAAEDLVEVTHRADVGIPRIAAPYARRIGHHGLQLGSKRCFRFAQQDCVAVG